mgnify:CR=1 FL=1
MDVEQQKKATTQVFETVADGYDHPSLRFFPFCADFLLQHLKPHSHSKILDVATGTGMFATAAAVSIAPTGRVTGIDLSEAMLAQLHHKASRMRLQNIDTHVMDAEQLEFRNDYFDAVVCSYGLFFMPDMDKALKSWLRVTKPGGTVMFTSFGEDAFHPLMSLFSEQIEKFGVKMAYKPVQLLHNVDTCRNMLENAGAQNVDVTTRQFGYHLRSAEDWWDALWNSGTRGYLDSLSPTDLAAFRRTHLQAVGELATDKGIWLDIQTHITRGHKPGS